MQIDVPFAGAIASLADYKPGGVDPAHMRAAGSDGCHCHVSEPGLLSIELERTRGRRSDPRGPWDSEPEWDY
ncbi:hypothetical protein ACFX2J_013330 [Malus domestica]